MRWIPSQRQTPHTGDDTSHTQPNVIPTASTHRARPLHTHNQTNPLSQQQKKGLSLTHSDRGRDRGPGLFETKKLK